ncbi:hypothetical protein Tco_0194848 [Tanacetum coccineum]
MDSQFQSLKEKMHEMRKNYNNRGGDHGSKNDDTPMCERHEANYIQFEGYQNQNSHDSYSHQSHHDPNDSEKSLTELNNDVKNDLEDFKRCIPVHRTLTPEHALKCRIHREWKVRNDNSRLMETCEALIMKMDSQFQSLKYELQDIRNKYYDLRDNHASKNQINDDTPMCKRHEVNSIQSRGYQIRDSPDSYSHQSHYDPKSNNDSEKSLTESNYDVKQDLEHFKSCIRSMRTVHDKLFDRDDQSKTDLEKSITKFLDGQRVTNMFLKKNINDIIIKMK